MKALIVYDTFFGNTEEIARAIGTGFGGEIEVRRAKEVNADVLEGLDLLVVGSPTQGGRPLPETRKFLDRVAAPAVKGMKVAAFDTRVTPQWVKMFGFAADRIAASLEKNGGLLAVPPEPFFVEKAKGPLKSGELEKAAEWGKKLAGGRLRLDKLSGIR